MPLLDFPDIQEPRQQQALTYDEIASELEQRKKDNPEIFGRLNVPQYSAMMSTAGPEDRSYRTGAETTGLLGLIRPAERFITKSLEKTGIPQGWGAIFGSLAAPSGNRQFTESAQHFGENFPRMAVEVGAMSNPIGMAAGIGSMMSQSYAKTGSPVAAGITGLSARLFGKSGELGMKALGSLIPKGTPLTPVYQEAINAATVHARATPLGQLSERALEFIGRNVGYAANMETAKAATAAWLDQPYKLGSEENLASLTVNMLGMSAFPGHFKGLKEGPKVGKLQFSSFAELRRAQEAMKKAESIVQDIQEQKVQAFVKTQATTPEAMDAVKKADDKNAMDEGVLDKSGLPNLQAKIVVDPTTTIGGVPKGQEVVKPELSAEGEDLSQKQPTQEPSVTQPQQPAAPKTPRISVGVPVKTWNEIRDTIPDIISSEGEDAAPTTPASVKQVMQQAGITPGFLPKSFDHFLDVFSKALPGKFGNLKVFIAGSPKAEEALYKLPAFAGHEVIPSKFFWTEGATPGERIPVIFINKKLFQANPVEAVLNMFQESGHFLKSSLSEAGQLAVKDAFLEAKRDNAQEIEDLRTGYSKGWEQAGQESPVRASKTRTQEQADDVLMEEWVGQQVVERLKNGTPFDKALSKSKVFIQEFKAFVNKFKGLIGIAKSDEDLVIGAAGQYGKVSPSDKLLEIFRRELGGEGKPGEFGEQMEMFASPQLEHQAVKDLEVVRDELVQASQMPKNDHQASLLFIRVFDKTLDQLKNLYEKHAGYDKETFDKVINTFSLQDGLHDGKLQKLFLEFKDDLTKNFSGTPNEAYVRVNNMFSGIAVRMKELIDAAVIRFAESKEQATPKNYQTEDLNLRHQAALEKLSQLDPQQQEGYNRAVEEVLRKAPAGVQNRLQMRIDLTATDEAVLSTTRGNAEKFTEQVLAASKKDRESDIQHEKTRGSLSLKPDILGEQDIFPRVLEQLTGEAVKQKEKPGLVKTAEEQTAMEVSKLGREELQENELNAFSKIVNTLKNLPGFEELYWKGRDAAGMDKPRGEVKIRRAVPAMLAYLDLLQTTPGIKVQTTFDPVTKKMVQKRVVSLEDAPQNAKDKFSNILNYPKFADTKARRDELDQILKKMVELAGPRLVKEAGLVKGETGKLEERKEGLFASPQTKETAFEQQKRHLEDEFIKRGYSKELRDGLTSVVLQAAPPELSKVKNFQTEEQAKKNGFTIGPLYHFTDTRDFSIDKFFSQSHFGTLKAAQDRGKVLNKERILSSSQIIKVFLKAGKITEASDSAMFGIDPKLKDFDEVLADPTDSSVLIRYRNKVEDVGSISWIVKNPEYISVVAVKPTNLLSIRSLIKATNNTLSELLEAGGFSGLDKDFELNAKNLEMDFPTHDSVTKFFKGDFPIGSTAPKQSIQEWFNYELNGVITELLTSSIGAEHRKNKLLELTTTMSIDTRQYVRGRLFLLENVIEAIKTSPIFEFMGKSQLEGIQTTLTNFNADVFIHNKKESELVHQIVKAFTPSILYASPQVKEPTPKFLQEAKRLLGLPVTDKDFKSSPLRAVMPIWGVEKMLPAAQFAELVPAARYAYQKVMDMQKAGKSMFIRMVTPIMATAKDGKVGPSPNKTMIDYMRSKPKLKKVLDRLSLEMQDLRAEGKEIPEGFLEKYKEGLSPDEATNLELANNFLSGIGEQGWKNLTDRATSSATNDLAKMLMAHDRKLSADNAGRRADAFVDAAMRQLNRSALPVELNALRANAANGLKPETIKLALEYADSLAPKLIELENLSSQAKYFRSEQRTGRYLVTWRQTTEDGGSEVFAPNGVNTTKELQKLQERAAADPLLVPDSIRTVDREAPFRQFSGLPVDVLNRFIALEKIKLDLALKHLPPELAEEFRSNYNIGDAILQEAKNTKLGVFTKKRKFIAGREELDMLESGIHYAKNLSFALAKQEARELASLGLKDPEVLANPRLKQWLTDYVSTSLNPPTAEYVKTKTGIAAYYMAFNWLQPIIESTQTAQTLAPYFTEKGFGITQGLKAISKAGVDLGGAWLSSKGTSPNLKGLELAFWNRANREGLFTETLHDEYNLESDKGVLDLLNATKGGDVSTAKEIAGNKLLWGLRLGMKPITKASHANSMVGWLAAFRLAMSKPGTKPEEAYTFAKESLPVGLYTGGIANRPMWMYGAGRLYGAAGVWNTLQGFTFNTVGMMYRQAVNSLPKSNLTPVERLHARKAIGQMIMTNVLLSGALGAVPGVAGLIALLEQNTDIKANEALRDWTHDFEKEDNAIGNIVGDTVMSGLPTALMPREWGIDLSQRIGLGSILGLNTYKGFDLAGFAGPTGSIIKNMLFDAPRDLLLNRDPHKALQDMVPASFKHMVELYRNNGQFLDNKGRLLFEPNTAQKFLYAIGGQPKELTELRKAQNMMERSDRIATKQRHMWYDSLADRLIKGDFEYVRAALLQKEQDDTNFDSRPALSAVVQLAQDKINPMDLLSQAASADKQGRAAIAATYPLRPRQSEVAKLIQRQQIESQVGIPGAGMLDPRKLNKAQVIDRLIRQYPTMTRPEAVAVAERMGM